MSSSLANKSFNVRISFDAQGQPIIGFAQGFYEHAENVVDILSVPTQKIAEIAASLGITKAEDFSVQALLRKNVHENENNLKINVAVSC